MMIAYYNLFIVKALPYYNDNNDNNNQQPNLIKQKLDN